MMLKLDAQGLLPHIAIVYVACNRDVQLQDSTFNAEKMASNLHTLTVLLLGLLSRALIPPGAKSAITCGLCTWRKLHLLEAVGRCFRTWTACKLLHHRHCHIKLHFTQSGTFIRYHSLSRARRCSHSLCSPCAGGHRSRRQQRQPQRQGRFLLPFPWRSLRDKRQGFSGRPLPGTGPARVPRVQILPPRSALRRV